MWLITPDFFISVVQKNPKSEMLCVRARAEGDLELLRDNYLPTLGKTQEGAGSDYPFRAYAQKGAVALAAAAIVRDITYSNMKNETQKRRGAEREHIFHKVWAALLALEPKGGKWSRWSGPLVSRSSLDTTASLWDDDRDRLDPYSYDVDDPDADLFEDQYTGLVAHCTICGEEVPVYKCDIDAGMTDEELVTATNRIGQDIARDCQFTADGSHWGDVSASLEQLG